MPIPKKVSAKECSNYCTITLISDASKVMLKILQASTVCELRTSKCSSWIEKAEEPEIKLPTSIGSQKKQENSRKTSTSALLIMPKPLTVWITTNYEKFFRRWEYQTTWLASWPAHRFLKMQVRWSHIPISLRIFQFVMIHAVIGLTQWSRNKSRSCFSGTLLLFLCSNGCWQCDIWFSK